MPEFKTLTNNEQQQLIDKLAEVLKNNDLGSVPIKIIRE
jgi:hypothetical protein